MELVLHIGTEKTGTTLIQKWLYNNQELLSKQGVFLSKVLGKPNNRKLPALFQPGFDDYMYLNGVYNQRQKDIFLGSLKSDFEEEVSIAKKSHKVMIVTSEHCHSRLLEKENVENLKAFLPDAFTSIKIVCYLREQSNLRKSLYSTALKITSKKKIENFHKNRSDSDKYYNYYEMARRWADVFGKNNLELRIYDRDSFVNGDIRLDFLSTLPCKVKQDRLNYDITEENESLSHLQGEAFRAINDSIPKQSKKHVYNAINLHFKSIFKRTKSLKTDPIWDPRQQDFFDRFIDSNQRLSDEFFGGRPLFTRPDGAGRDENEKRYSLLDVGQMINEVATIAMEEHPTGVLYPRDVKLLRDIAMKYESEDSVTRLDALILLEIAQRARPNATALARKIAKLKSE